MAPPSTDRISPTAHYTGTTWLRNGLGDPRIEAVLDTRRHDWIQLPMRLGRRLNGGIGLDEALVQRHRIIDALLAAEAAAHGPLQVIELPCGLSARGLRMRARHPDWTWIEADLPEMADRKRAALGPLPDRHRVVAVDLLQAQGPGSLAALVAQLDPGRPVVFVVEGMLNYFDADTVRGIWARAAAALGTGQRGRFLGDLVVGAHIRRMPLARVFLALLGTAVRGRMHLHFPTPAAATAAMAGCGWTAVDMHHPSDHPELGLPAAGKPDCIGVLDATRPGGAQGKR